MSAQLSLSLLSFYILLAGQSGAPQPREIVFEEPMVITVSSVATLERDKKQDPSLWNEATVKKRTD